MRDEKTYHMTVEANAINAVYRFVRAHSFEARIVGMTVVFEIPYTQMGIEGIAGFETCKVRTMREARRALGY